VSMHLFSTQHYHETSMEDIAAAVGMPASGIYRYFTGKPELLATSFRRAADRVSGDIADVLAAEKNPERALNMLIDAYVARSFADPDLATAYYTERGNLPDADRALLHNVQLATVEAWVRLAVAARPELPPERARFAVHAAFALVVDLGRLVGYDTTEQSRARVKTLMAAVLLRPPPARIES
ncbi:MAG: TetR/AcrR family transcriptional regulator, partial [Mycolicibacterium sp.]|nr:TetR/AcrR family transcriptional regulator [Mycolicibacterium sp.]